MGRGDAKAFLAKAEQFLASAEENLAAGRFTVAAGDAVHAGISAKDAIVTALTGATSKHQDHRAAVPELRAALSTRDTAASAERALKELLAAKPDVEYSAEMLTEAKAKALVRRAASLVDTADAVVRLGD